jgi:type VI secretion system protein ImpI
MPLILTIENETSLPDGGPLSVTVAGRRGIDIGRDTHLDWTLPDPSRFISGKHCEIRHKDGGYWLHDVSTNGTFLYGANGRLTGPHLLRNGDRLVIGNYIVAVTLDGEEAAASARAHTVEPANYNEIWNPTEPAAPPVERSAVQSPREAPKALGPDFLDWAADVPETSYAEPAARPADRHDSDDLDWARGGPKPVAAEEPPPAMPNPRRPVWVSNEPDGPWAAPAEPARAAQPQRPAPQPFAEPPPIGGPPGDDPPVTPVQAAASMPAASSTGAAGAVDLAQWVAQGARVPPEFFAQRDPEQLAQELGLMLRVVIENLRQLLNARLEARRLARTANQTMIQALDNNPLKFSPTAEDALRIMFGPATHSYLDARRTFEQSFDDLKTHQIKTYAAMQNALSMLIEDLDPQTIDQQAGGDRGLAGMVGSRKARLWDAYVARWQAKTARHDSGMVDAFMQYFADCYDRAGNERR